MKLFFVIYWTIATLHNVLSFPQQQPFLSNWTQEGSLLPSLNALGFVPGMDKDSSGLSIGNSAYLASVPKGTLLYHGHDSFDGPNGTFGRLNWFAFSRVHAAMFPSLSQDGLKRLSTYRVRHDLHHLVFSHGVDVSPLGSLNVLVGLGSRIRQGGTGMRYEDIEAMCKYVPGYRGWVADPSGSSEIMLCHTDDQPLDNVLELVNVEEEISFDLEELFQELTALSNVTLLHTVHVHWASQVVLLPFFKWDHVEGFPLERATDGQLDAYSQRWKLILRDPSCLELQSRPQLQALDRLIQSELSSWYNHLRYRLTRTQHLLKSISRLSTTSDLNTAYKMVRHMVDLTTTETWNDPSRLMVDEQMKVELEQWPCWRHLFGDGYRKLIYHADLLMKSIRDRIGKWNSPEPPQDMLSWLQDIRKDLLALLGELQLDKLV